MSVGVKTHRFFINNRADVWQKRNLLYVGFCVMVLSVKVKLCYGRKCSGNSGCTINVVVFKKHHRIF